MNQKKKGVCYLTIQDITLKGVTKTSTTNLKNIRLEILYGKSRNLSKITTNLTTTGFKESMNDMFRLLFEDLTMSQTPEGPIIIRAYDIDYSGKGTGEGDTG
jgi:hypothetical protein